MIETVWNYIADKGLNYPTSLFEEFKCDDKLSRIVPFEGNVRRTRSKSMVNYDTFFDFLRNHMDVAPIGKRKEVMERLAGLQWRVREARERAGSWVGWVRRACVVWEEAVEEVKGVKKEVKEEKVVDSGWEPESESGSDTETEWSD